MHNISHQLIVLFSGPLRILLKKSIRRVWFLDQSETSRDFLNDISEKYQISMIFPFKNRNPSRTTVVNDYDKQGGVCSDTQSLSVYWSVWTGKAAWFAALGHRIRLWGCCLHTATTRDASFPVVCANWHCKLSRYMHNGLFTNSEHSAINKWVAHADFMSFLFHDFKGNICGKTSWSCNNYLIIEPHLILFCKEAKTKTCMISDA